MAWRFRKSVKVLPGVRVNLPTRGVSATLGPRGATVSVDAQGVYGNLGLVNCGRWYSGLRAAAAEPRAVRQPAEVE